MIMACTTWQRLLVTDREKYGRWSRTSDHMIDGIFSDVVLAVRSRLPPECVSPSGKMRLVRKDVTVKQMLAAVYYATFPLHPYPWGEAFRKSAIENLDRLWDASAEDIETVIHMSKLTQIVPR